MNNIFRFALILFLVNLVASSVLAGVYILTKSGIQLQQALIEKESFKEVMPESIGDRIEPVEQDGSIKYWKVYKGSEERPSGYIFIAKKYGYSNVIETVVGMDDSGRITGARILSQNETPGLGAKIIEIVTDKTMFKALKGIFSKEKEPEEKILPYFTEQFKGMDVRSIELSRYGIHAVTGATISSRAVLDSIRQKGLEILGK